MPKGLTRAADDDGLTTRERRKRPVVVVHTGDGKGKSTAAFGLALRGWHQGWSIAVYQFIKSGRWRTGEEEALRTLGGLHEASGKGGPVSWETMGSGWTWLRSNVDDDPAERAREGWERVRAELASEAHDLYVLDEFNHVLDKGWVDVDDVVRTLRDRPGRQHVVITGRRAPEALMSAADLVTEMKKIKHPFDAGQRGQAGIEW